ncbi:glycosyltransferase family 87 protein [Pandoraea vervacti]|nr:glycosyltransferase family 87 protein [Pandoraea vervacti]
MTSKPSAVTEATPPAPSTPCGPGARRHWSEDSARLRFYGGAGIFMTLAVLCVWAYRYFLSGTPTISPAAVDFLPFWGAAHFVLHGHAIDAYDVELMSKLQIAEQPWAANLGGYLPWLYPPVMMVFVTPFALLPYVYAYVLYALIGLSLYYAALRRTLRWPDARVPTLGFPGVMLVIVTGQIALYTTALAGFSLAMLRKRPVWAGVFAGLLFVKPHVALLFPLAFLCAREWRALAACIVTVVGTTLLAATLFGVDVYAAFLHASTFARESISNGAAQIARVPTFFITARMLGAPVGVAAAIHAVIALGAVAVLIDFWRRPGVFALRAATLVCATTLVSPYLYDYDLALLAVVIAWYVRDGVARGWLRGEREWLVLLWITPMLGLLGSMQIGVQFLPFITLGTLVMLWRRRRRLAHVADASHPAHTDGDRAVAPLRRTDSTPAFTR